MYFNLFRIRMEIVCGTMYIYTLFLPLLLLVINVLELFSEVVTLLVVEFE